MVERRELLTLSASLALEELTSDREISTGVLDTLPSVREFGLVERWFHRSRTPSTALKKLVDPVAIVLEIASLVGASCSWRCRSCRPSCSRNVISSTTLGLMLHGWLHH